MKDQMHLRSVTRMLHLSLLLAIALLPLQAGDVPRNTTVYREGSKARVHVKACRRYKSKDPGIFTSMKYSEAEAKGIPLCSRCPGSTTAGKGNPDATQGQAYLNAGRTVGTGTPGKTVHRPVCFLP